MSCFVHNIEKHLGNTHGQIWIIISLISHILEVFLVKLGLVLFVS